MVFNRHANSPPERLISILIYNTYLLLTTLASCTQGLLQYIDLCTDRLHCSAIIVVASMHLKVCTTWALSCHYMRTQGKLWVSKSDCATTVVAE